MKHASPPSSPSPPPSQPAPHTQPLPEEWTSMVEYPEEPIDLGTITSSQVEAANAARPASQGRDPLSPFPRFPPTPDASARTPLPFPMGLSAPPSAAPLIEPVQTPDFQQPPPHGSQSSSLADLLRAAVDSQHNDDASQPPLPLAGSGTGPDGLQAHPPLPLGSYYDGANSEDDAEGEAYEPYPNDYRPPPAQPRRKRKHRSSFESASATSEGDGDEEWEEEEVGMAWGAVSTDIGDGTMETERKAMRREIDSLPSSASYDPILLRYFHLFCARFTLPTTVGSGKYIRTDSLLAAFELAMHPTWNERKSIENGIRDGSWLPGGADAWGATPAGTNKRMGSNMWGEGDSVQLKNLLLLRKWRDGVTFGIFAGATGDGGAGGEGGDESADGEWGARPKRRRGRGSPRKRGRGRGSASALAKA